jgi:hypothetical protein
MWPYHLDLLDRKLLEYENELNRVKVLVMVSRVRCSLGRCY